jgi:hypothetical protein
MPEEKYYINLKKQVEFIWPQDVLQLSDMDLLSKVWLKPSTLESNDAGDELYFNSGIVFQEAVSLNPSFVDGLSLILGTQDLTTEINVSVTITNFSEITIPHTTLQVGPLPVTISWDNSLLTPAENVGTELAPEFIPVENAKVNLTVEGILISADTEGNLDMSFESQLSIPPVFIGQTSIVLEADSASIFLSKNNQAPPGFEPGFQGVYFEKLNIYFSNGLSSILPDGIEMHNAAIGSGGFSGAAILNWEDTVKEYDESTAKTFFGFGFTFQKLEIGFAQNTLTQSSITGFLKIPFFDEAVKIEIGLTNDGGFTIGITHDDGLLTLIKPGIISIEVTSLEFINEENIYSIKISGKLTPLLAGLNWPSFDLKGLTISSDGTVQVEGGWIELPEQKGLDFYGFKIEISKLGFGSDTEDNIEYKWIGFSGGIQIVDSLPLKGGVEGLKVMWSAAGDVKLKIGGVYLSFEIDKVLTFDGAVYFIDEPDKKEFRGGVDLNIIPINLGVDAQFITGKTNEYNYFYIVIGLDLPVGIPLGPPVLGLYGLAGLFGYNMSLDYQKLIDYDSVETRPDLTDIGNWFNQKDALAFGASLTVGTLPDAKLAVKAKALFVILIPGPVLLIEGHAGLLTNNDSYQMTVLAVLDANVGSFLLNISAAYQFPSDSGELLDVEGSAEAFFSAADPNNWHLYLGEKDPEAKRIRADILSLFKAQTYLMIDSKGLLMGAWIGYGLDKKYGILHVVLEAWMSGELGLSTMPLQAKGSVTLYGNAELSASIVKLGISVQANVAVQAPKPLKIEASLEVQLKTPLGKPKATISLKWENTKEPPYPFLLSATLGVEHRKVTKNWEIPKYSRYKVDADRMYAGEELSSINIPYVPVVPPDVYMVLNFDKPVTDINNFGANPAPASSIYEKVGDYEFKYELINISLDYCDTWDEQAMETGDWKNYISSAGDYSLSGNWQFIPGTAQGNTKLFLNASTPFEISRVLSDSDVWYNTLNVYNPNYPCVPGTEIETICADMEDRDLGTYYFILVQDEFIFTSPYPLDVHGYVAPWLGTNKALSNVDGYETIECLNIKVQETTEHINVKIIKEVIFTAGIGYDSYLQLTDQFSTNNVELYVNQSYWGDSLIPSYISFPEIAFPDLPVAVWISCIVFDTAAITPFFYAFDKDGNVLDTANLAGSNGKLVIYKLKSATLPIRKIGIVAIGIRIVEVCYEVHHKVETASILVTPPQDIINADLHLSKSSQGTVYLYNRENRQLRQIEFDIPSALPDEEVQPVALSLETGEAFRSFLVTGNFDIIMVCGVTQEAQDIYNYNGGLMNHLQTSVEETWGQHINQILEPNKYYRLSIETKSSSRKNGGSWEGPGTSFEEYMFFKTGNPPGPPAPTQLEAGTELTLRYDLDSPLTSLSSYVDYTIPAGAAAGEAQPFVYRSYDVGVVYNDSYIEQMYLMTGQSLSMRLIDNNNLPVTDALGQELIFTNLWGDNLELATTTEEERYGDIITAGTCIAMTTLTAETKKEIIASSRDLLLKSQTQYRAQVIAAETKVYEFTFLSSRYASFTQHIHSFSNIAWNHFELLGDVNYQTDIVALENILNNTENEQVKFEQLMLLFDLNPRQLPEQTEIMLMNDKNKKHGLLFESQEPVDWERFECSVQFANRTEPVEEFYDSVKITDGSVQEEIINVRTIELGQNHWVELLLMESADLSDFTIEYRNLNAAAEEYLEFYRFTVASIYNSGTLIRIFSGTEPASTSDETEHINLYARHASSIFSTAGTSVRIKDKDGQVLHTRIIYNKNEFDELETSIYRNEDGTRFFIFRKRGTLPYNELQNGIYQIRCTYKRDLGEDQPVLKRFGFSDAEETLITFSLL